MFIKEFIDSAPQFSDTSRAVGEGTSSGGVSECVTINRTCTVRFAQLDTRFECRHYDATSPIAATDLDMQVVPL